MTGFEAGAQALGGWLDTTKDPKEAPDPAIFKALEAASEQLNEERKTGRAKILEQTSAATHADGDSAGRSRNPRVGRSYRVSLMAPDRIAENRFRQMTGIHRVLKDDSNATLKVSARDCEQDFTVSGTPLPSESSAPRLGSYGVVLMLSLLLLAVS